MSNTLDKDAITWGQKQYHIALCPEDIGEYVLLPGDYIRYIEKAIECPIKYVSVGAERDAYITMF